MKKLLVLSVLTLLAGTMAGCHSCQKMTGGWFNRGDRCNECPPVDCPQGVPRTGLMYPTAPTTVLPGPIEIAPVN